MNDFPIWHGRGRQLFVSVLLMGTCFACSASGSRLERTPSLIPPHTTLADPTALRVGTSGDYPPFSLQAADGSFSGFDVDVARAYAAARGRHVVFVRFAWPELAARLMAGDFDVAMSGITVRADRLAISPMTPVVARSEAIVVVRGTPAGTALDTLTSLDRPERRIGVNRGGHLERLTHTHLPRATIVAIDDNQRLPRLLAAAEVDAIVTDTLELAAWSRDPIGGGGTGRFAVSHSLSRDRKAYWIAPHDEALAADLTSWLLAREQDGLLRELRRRHFGTSPPAPLPPEVAWLCELIVRRLVLMPVVAEVKRRTVHDVEDQAREAAVTAAAARDARTVGLDPAATLVLVRAEMTAAKAAQRATRAASEQHQMTLADLRTAINRLDRAILRQLARVAPVRVQAGVLLGALQADVEVPGVDRTALRRIADAISAMPGAHPSAADSLAPISRAIATPWGRDTATQDALSGIPIGVGGFLY